MKQTLLATTAIALAFVIPAQAADMPVKAPPRAVETTSWAGFYVGAHVGYGYAVTGLDAAEFQLGQIIGAGSKGWVAGGLGGYNMMLAPRWVAGVEVDGSWQNIKTRISFFDNEAVIKGSADWSASVRARLGYLMTPTSMLFVTAGWSWSELELSITESGDLLEKHRGSISGPQVGFGVETMWTRNWIIRTEYLHSFYDNVTFNTTLINGNPSPVALSPWVGVIRSALIYKPGTATPTAWPDRAVMPTWAGFYVGGMLGPLMASAKLSIPSQGFTGDGGGVSAVVPSAMAGYNIMIAPRWLAGIEAEIAPNISTSDVKIEWTGAVRGRLGYLVTPAVLAYGTLGWGTAGVKDITHSQLNTPIPVERIHALGIGTGVEAAISDRWRLRADYQYYVTNTIDLVLPGNLATTVKATSQTARLGAVYQISGP